MTPRSHPLDTLTVRKRAGSIEKYHRGKVERAVRKALVETEEHVTESDKRQLFSAVEKQALNDADKGVIGVEQLQNVIERQLMTQGLHATGQAYVLYRHNKAILRSKALDRVGKDDLEAVESNRKYFPDDLQIFQLISKYARWRDDLGRRETWEEVVDRVMTFCRSHMEKHYPGVITSEEWSELATGMLNLESLPAMRMVQMAGPAAERDATVIYNCSYDTPDSFESFSEMLYILMAGCGAGFSVEADYVESLPRIKKQKSPAVVTSFVVEDSTEGWCDALLAGFKTWYAGEDMTFDTSKVRKAGMPLKIKGGRASGPQPLIDLLDFTRKAILARQGRRLHPIDVHDIRCMTGRIVQVGGVRRAAEISLSDLDDLEMREAKSGAYWTQAPWRAMSNNSTVYDTRPSDVQFMEEWLSLAKSGTGERGIFNREAAIKHAPKRRKRARFGANPCNEISLRPRQFCNLSISVARSDDTPETLKNKVRLATYWGTVQSTMTHFKYLGEEWLRNCEDERLLGVDITGQVDCPLLRYKAPGRETLLDELRELAVETNAVLAKRLGINQSAAVTCVKPSGNSAALLGCSSGLHPRYSDYYIRRVRVNAIDPVCQLLRDAGVPHNPETGDDPTHPTVWVFDFPVKSPPGAVTRHDMTALEQLDNWLQLKTHYTEHNPSFTCYVKSEEWMAAGAWVLAHWDLVNGVSFLPASDHLYQLAPYEEITAEHYERLKADFPTIPWHKLSYYELEDTTTVNLEYACVGGSCDL